VLRLSRRPGRFAAHAVPGPGCVTDGWTGTTVTDPRLGTTALRTGVPGHGRHPSAQGTTPERVTAVLVAAAVVGCCASGYLAAAGTALGTHLPGVHLWVYDGTLLSAHLQSTVRGVVGNTGALAALAASWFLAGVAVRRGASLRALLLVAVVTAVPLVLGPPLFSPDVYHYASVGAAMQHGINPYVAGPGVIGDLPAVRGSEPAWRFAPSPYGPPFLQLVSQLSGLLGQDLIRVTIALRVLAIAAWASLAFSLPALARRCGTDPRWAVWLGMANPLVLLHGVSAAHNDVLVMALLAAGLLLTLADRSLLGVLCCVAASGVKVTALAAVGVVAVDLARRQVGWWPRLRALALAGGLGAGGFVALVVAARLGWRWVRALSTPGLVVEPLSPPSALAVSIDPAAPPLSTVRSLALLAGAVVCLALLTRLRSWGLVRVTGWVLVTVAVAGPALWPWYLLPPMVAFAGAATLRETRFVVGLSVALLYTVQPGGQPVLSLFPRPLVDRLVLAVLVLLVWWGGAHLVAGLRARRGPAALRREGPDPGVVRAPSASPVD
jgi:alpha-1,6-mannosyltransferase